MGLFDKDSIYQYKAWWTNEQVLHLFPHWNWNEGKEVKIWAYSNAHTVEVFVNDKSLGNHTVPTYDAIE